MKKKSFEKENNLLKEEINKLKEEISINENIKEQLDEQILKTETLKQIAEEKNEKNKQIHEKYKQVKFRINNYLRKLKNSK